MGQPKRFSDEELHERKKAKARIYAGRPEVREYQRVYKKTRRLDPVAVAKDKDADARYRKEYEARPEVRARAARYQRELRADPIRGAAIKARKAERSKDPVWRAAQRERLSTPEAKARAHASAVKFKYGITLDQVDSLWDEQGGTCGNRACSGVLDHTDGRTANIDHDHKCCSGVGACGECVRGTLCWRCNVGRFGDDIDLMKGKIAYLEYWQERHLGARIRTDKERLARLSAEVAP